MKLRTTVGSLLDAFAIVASTLDTKGAASNLYLQANDKSGFLYLYSTNLISETATKIKAEINTPGEALVNPGKLKNGLSGIDKTASVTLELAPTGNQLKIQSGKIRFALACSVDVKEIGSKMKTLPSTVAATTVIPATELIEFTKRSSFCIPNDMTGQRASLAVLKLGEAEDKGEEAFATDGYIIVHVAARKKQGKGSLGAGVLIPTGALPSLSSLVLKKKGQTIDIIIPEAKNKIHFRFADGTYLGALTNSTQYPDLRSLVNKTQDYCFQVSREQFRSALTRADAFVNQGTTKKNLELVFSNILALFANGDDSLSDEVDITYIGKKPSKEIRLGMNIEYLAKIAASSDSEFLKFQFSEANQPLVITDNHGDEDDMLDIKYIVTSRRL